MERFYVMMASSLTLGVGLMGVGALLVILGFRDTIVEYLKKRERD